MPFQRFSENVTCWYCRLSYPHVWEAAPVMVQGVPVSEPRFSTIAILHDDIVARIRAIEARLIAQSWPEWPGGQPPEGIKLSRALQQGSVYRPGDPHLAGKWILSANAKQDSPPWIVTKDPATGRYLPVTDRSRIYGGCECHVNVGIYTGQIKTSEPRINVGLNGLEITDRQLPSFENRTTAEQALGGGPDIAAPPPPPGGADVPAPTYYPPGQTAAPPPRGVAPIHYPPGRTAAPTHVDVDDPLDPANIDDPLAW